MRFSVFRPDAGGAPLPVVYFLAGLTCSEETFAIKAGAQRAAAELGLVLVAPDTSPRDTGIDAATGDWEFGEGAGFYVDATEAPYATRFRMASWIADELPNVIRDAFDVDTSRSGLCGHSMGGHGALTIALRHPDRYRSVSAFAPIVAPTRVPWGTKAFSRYLGSDVRTWNAYDACELVRDHRFPGTILIDQGDRDGFLETQLQPQRFDAACRAVGQALEMRMRSGYDHSYWFIQTYIEDHLLHHAAAPG
jgi:S-formylglutathione hydrolase